MTKKRKSKSNGAILKIIVGLTLTFFVLSLFSIFWSWIGSNAKIIAIVTGILLVLFMLFRFITPRKVRNRIKRRLSIGY